MPQAPPRNASRRGAEIWPGPAEERDRLSDVDAGQRAGCRSALVTTGAHAAAPIESPDPFDGVTPDVMAVDLESALEALGVT